MTANHPTRRSILKSAGGLGAALALGGASVLAAGSAARAADDGFGLHISDRNEGDARMWYYRFRTAEIGWEPAVNVLLPDDYHTSGRDADLLSTLWCRIRLPGPTTAWLPAVRTRDRPALLRCL